MCYRLIFSSEYGKDCLPKLGKLHFKRGSWAEVLQGLYGSASCSQPDLEGRKEGLPGSLTWEEQRDCEHSGVKPEKPKPRWN